MATYIKPEAIKDASLPIGKVATMSEDERLAFLVQLGLGNLAEVPDDGKVYGRTYGEWVEDEDGAVYELIEEITLEEAVQKIVRKTEPDGTPYNFKRMRVIIVKPSNVFGIAFRQVFGFNTQIPDMSPLCSIMANETYAHLAITTCKISNGYWDITMHTQNQNGVGQNSYGMPYAVEATGNTARILVYQLSCSESVLFEVGTNIKIYGIR